MSEYPTCKEHGISPCFKCGASKGMFMGYELPPLSGGIIASMGIPASFHDPKNAISGIQAMIMKEQASQHEKVLHHHLTKHGLWGFVPLSSCFEPSAPQDWSSIFAAPSQMRPPHPQPRDPARLEREAVGLAEEDARMAERN